MLESALATTVATVIDLGASVAPQIAIVAAVGIALGAVGFGIKYLWRMFKGTA